ncbi:MAG: class I SAM-dependent methyltransferase [Propionibacteriaceae bacterium]|jgi:SAM-dependent methyltransferase|nr:class I SAM-dependent methyltransferase [Propionibacteriaceae bacterium]
MNERILLTGLAMLAPRERFGFIRSLPQGAHVLDVGCGTNSPQRTKTLRPDLYYAGIDIGDYQQDADPRGIADEYVLTSPEDFPAGVGKFSDMDAVISSHNFEHVYEPQPVLRAMVDALKPGGRLYMGFPCEESVGFPPRAGTLNFYDDDTHQQPPPWLETLRTLHGWGLNVEYAAKRYRPPLLWLGGLLGEPISSATKRVLPLHLTWSYWGFVSVIWARKGGPDFV